MYQASSNHLKMVFWIAFLDLIKEFLAEELFDEFSLEL